MFDFEYDEVKTSPRGVVRYYLAGTLVGKRCNGCDSSIACAGFGMDPNAKIDGLARRCKQCASRTTRSWYSQNTESTLEKLTAKRKSSPRHFGEIRRRSAEKRKGRSKEELRLLRMAKYPSGFKWCRQCTASKAIDEFYQSLSEADGLSRLCADCDDVSRRARRRKKVNIYWASVGIDPTFCFYCEFPIYDGDELHSDHVIALENGGPDTMENQVPTCRSCNICKSDKDFMVFLAEDFPYQEDQERILDKLTTHGIAWAL